ncbi:5-(carboxyamino)imidazole ribonucleotide synthase [Aquabacterium fontiphilum]|nr:5-(carboxyamino)imidazole ribonucleotide synthase [Aquabacterium fontiphilum]
MGGGQLGRMFVHAAQAMGYRTAVLDADPDSPAGCVSHAHIRTGYLDEAGLAELARVSAAVTTEFENVPAAALEQLAASRPVAPAGSAVAVCQDRAREKAHFVGCGVDCAPHALIETPAQLAAVTDELLPGILKTARLGYDGKGQIRVKTRAELEAAWAELQHVACVLEKMLPLAYEVSVIVARGRDGQVVHFPLQQNLHRDGILAVTQVPAPNVTEAVSQQAYEAAHRIAASLDYVGVLCVEFFVLTDGRIVANEMAPRPHNSGHHTIDACDVSQFELQVRAMTGLPLVEPVLHSPCVMLNLLGDLWFPLQAGVRAAAQREPDWAAVLALSGTHLHLYGKTEARVGRKMGHLTITGATPAAARETALKAAAILGISPF